MTGSHTTAVDDDDALRRERRELPAQVVLAWYRLVKSCQLYDDSNQTVRQLVPAVVEAVSRYCTAFDTDTIRVLVTRDMVFVNRRIMRARRETYTTALQLGELLEHARVNEIVVEQGVSPESVLRLARLVVESQRDAGAREELERDELPGVTARLGVSPDELSQDEELSPIARVLKSYAASILVLQSFYDELEAGRRHATHDAKRIAQKLVAISERHPELLVATAAAPLADASRARSAVSSAVFGIAMARKLTADRAQSTAVALAALLAESGAVVSRSAESPIHPAVATLVEMASSGGFQETALRRSVIAYETLALKKPHGQLYGATTDPTVLASILFVARRFDALRAPDGNRGRRIDEALAALESELTAAAARPYAKLLVSALGLVPTDTYVELTTGEIAVVVGVPAVALDYARPPVRLLTDTDRSPLAEPKDVNLARPGRGEPARQIRRPIVTTGA